MAEVKELKNGIFTKREQMQINFETKVYDLLKMYPQLFDVLLGLSPRYKKLKNPLLKRTIARVASLRQASYLGGMTPEKLVNILRAEVGQDPIYDTKTNSEITKELPSWAKEKEKIHLNATQLLEEDKNPFSVLTKSYKQIKENEVILLESDFIPSPLIEQMRKKNAWVVALESEKEGWYKTYIKKVKKD